jgi:hypothetical protein
VIPHATIPDQPENEDPVLRKFHYIDPGMMQYQRATFERMFQSVVVPLSGEELKKIAEGRRLKLSMEDTMVVLLVYSGAWENATDDTWNSMAELLNDWSASQLLRETLSTLLSCAADIPEDPLKISLKVRKEAPE